MLVMTASSPSGTEALRPELRDPVTPSSVMALRLARVPCGMFLIFIVAIAASRLDMPVAFCAFKQLSGLPCPGCGVTTSIAALLQGNVTRAVKANIAGPFVAIFFLVQMALVVGAALCVIRESSILRIARASDQILLIVLVLAWTKRLI